MTAATGLNSMIIALQNERLEKPAVAACRAKATRNYRAEYAKDSEFCEVFERDTKPLYLLAFLLTANHKDAELCLVSTIADCFKGPAVFRGWARSWVKRTLIKQAIQIAAPASSTKPVRRDSWGLGAAGTPEIDVITKLAALERFVFVISILEGHTATECALLLGCHVERVMALRAQALRELPSPAVCRLESTATFSSALGVST
jgi:DNA-directed RNA polymerase specialized sigma24 family protein